MDTTANGAAGESNFENNLTSIQLHYIDGKNPVVTSARLFPSFVKTGQLNSIVYSATDDVGIKTMDFYYSTNGGVNWTPIEEGYVPPTPPMYGASYSWLIPTNLPVGTNLDVRVVARDTSGNWGETNAGPYLIHSGTAPTVTVLSPNGGELWNMGSQQQISWNLSAPNGATDFSVRFYHDNQVDFLRVPLPSGNGTYTWTLPTPFSTTNGLIHISVMDVNGNVAEDDSDGYFSVRDTSAPPPAPWTTPTIVTANAANDPVSIARIATDAAGNVHLVYLSTIDTGFDPRFITQTIRYMKRTGSVWSAPQTAYSVMQQTDGNLTGFGSLQDLQVAVSSAGTPHVVWVKSFSSGSITNRNQDDIFYTTFDGANWTVPFNVSANLPNSGGTATTSREPALKVDSSGTAHIVWGDGIHWNPDFTVTGTNYLFYRKRTAAGGWTTTEQITSNSSYAALAIDQNDALHVAYIGPSLNDIAYMNYNGSGWSSPLAIASDVSDSIRLVSDGNNHLHVVWRYYNQILGQAQLMYELFDGTNWLQKQVVIASPNGIRPALAADSYGRPHVTWEDQGFPQRLLYTYGTGSSWSSPIQVNLDSQRVVDRSSDAALSLTNNELHTVWVPYIGGVGAGQVLYNHANVENTNDIFAPSVTVAVPVVGANLSIGSSFPIQWNATDNTGGDDRQHPLQHEQRQFMDFDRHQSSEQRNVCLDRAQPRHEHRPNPRDRPRCSGEFGRRLLRHFHNN